MNKAYWFLRKNITGNGVTVAKTVVNIVRMVSAASRKNQSSRNLL